MAKSEPCSALRRPPPKTADLPYDEARLGARFAAGDRMAAQEVVVRHEERIRRLVLRLLGWGSDVEDVVQDVFVSALDKKARFRGESRLETWLVRIALLREASSAAEDEDDICRELKAIVELREKAYARAKKVNKGRKEGAGYIGLEVVERMEGAYRAARVDYLRARKKASQSAGGDKLAVLNTQLADLAAHIVKEKAVLQATSEQIDKLTAELSSVRRTQVTMDRYQQKVDLLQSTAKSLSTKRAALAAEEKSFEPVTVTPWPE